MAAFKMGSARIRSLASFRIWLWAAMFSLILVSCQADDPVLSGSTPRPPDTPPSTLLPTVVVEISRSESGGGGSLDGSQLQPAVVHSIETPLAESTPLVSTMDPGPGETEAEELPPTATPTMAPTAGPTFTPPPRPESSPWDHFWLNRPVPDGVGVWTDKAYPYGSTRGGQLRPHHGVEFNVPSGTPVMAAAGGTVILAGDDAVAAIGESLNFYGNVIVVQHGFTLAGRTVLTLYGHLSELLVETGQEVSAREVIAHSGASGVADGAHLHFEVRVGQNSYEATRNPLLWLYPFPERGVVTGRIIWPDGSPAQGVPLRLERVDGQSPYAATTTYSGQSVNGDDNWAENFAFDDVTAGYYRLVAGTTDNNVESEFWVFPTRTTFVELFLSG